MPRGDPPKKFEDLLQYFLGARYALAAIYTRVRDSGDADVTADLRNHVRMLDQYIEAVKETNRLKKG